MINDNNLEKALKADQKRLAGEFEKNAGEKAYHATAGIYGFFAVIDRAQSALTGRSMTNEVAQIRKGERLTAEADALVAETEAVAKPK